MCLVSVLMSTYNESELELRLAIESILNQTYRNIEFIIVSDNPQNTMLQNIINEYQKKDRRIKVILNNENLGLPRSLNKGIEQARGKYIARMDADDISLPNRIEEEMDFMLINNLDMVAALQINIDENNKTIEKKPLARMTPEDVNYLLPHSCFIAHPSVIFKKSTVIKLGGYRNITPAQDYDLWLRMISHGYRIGVLDKFLIKHRIRALSISRKNIYKQILTSNYLQNAYKNNTLNRDEDIIIREVSEYLANNSHNNILYRNKFNIAYNIFTKGINEIKNKHILKGLYKVGMAAFINRKCRLVILHLVKYKLLYQLRFDRVISRKDYHSTCN